ncbi:hypothetical protein [Sphingobium phenoxybenzoativorans]|uniref:hypothetical protein n=1 Tax=Sphingobium phenoxybenzoativorans TaxID=1592790 RepID=UPI0014957E4D|nr:hypothetical protein [Sphingobium phenoxybenzoativorans]
MRALIAPTFPLPGNSVPYWMTDDSLITDWEAMEWTGEAILVETFDGEPIISCVPKMALG